MHTFTSHLLQLSVPYNVCKWRVLDYVLSCTSVPLKENVFNDALLILSIDLAELYETQGKKDT